jgi:nucleotide-binding universal stress UspA family protein
MKTILVPTDFSKNANRAFNYACNLALQTGAKIILMNAYQSPASTSNVMINFTDILEEDSKKDLVKDLAKQKENSSYDSIDIEAYSCYGYLSEAIKKANSEFTIDLVVMGTSGASNLSNRLFGSNTTDAIKNAEQPILVVPNKTEYSPWKNITFASNIQTSKNDCPFKPLKELITMPNCKLNILTVVEDLSTVDTDKINERISTKLEGIDYKINVVVNEKVSDGILDFINTNETDLLVLIRKNYGFIEGLIHSSVTKKIALHANKPMLLYKSCE